MVLQFHPPKPFRAKVEETIKLNDKYEHYHFELIGEAHTMPFLAGQYVSMRVADRGDRRSYSIASSPAIEHGFELLIDVAPQGLGTQFLQQLQIGDEVDLLAPMGRFVFNPDSDATHISLIATGSGIAPYRSMLFDLLQVKNEQRPITLYWGMRYAEHLFWLDEFQELMDSFPQFHFVPVLSKAPADWTLSRGRVTDLIGVADFSPKTDFYLCGSTAMIKDMVQLLAKKEVEAKRIYHEAFF